MGPKQGGPARARVASLKSIFTRGPNAAAVAVLAAAVAATFLVVEAPERASAYTPHAPILIDGDGNFTTANGVTSGNGWPTNPYLIEGWEIDASSSNGIEVRNTTAYFVVRGVRVHSGGLTTHGVVLWNADNGRVENSTIAGMFDYYPDSEPVGYWAGILVADSSNAIIDSNRVSNNIVGIERSGFSGDVTISGNTISNSSFGVYDGGYATAFGLLIDLNTISNSDYGIYVGGVATTVISNSLTNGALGLGCASASQCSSHTITDDNVVDGNPLYYYKNCAGTTIDGIPVGQLILSNCRNVRVSNLTLYPALDMRYVDDVAVTSSNVSLSLVDASNMTISSNNIGGLSLDSRLGPEAGAVTVSSNQIELVWLEAMTGASTRVFHNTIGWGYDAWSPGAVWDDGYPSGGNTWRGYQGRDDCSGPLQDVCPDPDGIGDTPQGIEMAKLDRYPRMPPPDLAVDPADISVSPTPPYRQGESVWLNATVRNVGGLASNATTARFHDGTPPSTQIGADQPLPPLAPNATTVVSVQWNASLPGPHDLCVALDPADLVAEWSEANNVACIRVAVGLPTAPDTVLVVGQPRWDGGPVYVTSATPLVLNATDRSSTGIRLTMYRVDGAPWGNFTASGPFRLAGEGGHLVEWFSEDFVGNVEPTRSASLWVDDTPPTSTLSYSDGPFTPRTVFRLSAQDAGSGVADTRYRVDGGAWIADAREFALPAGKHTVRYGSVDRVNNTEAQQVLVVEVAEPLPILPIVTSIATPAIIIAVILLGGEDVHLSLYALLLPAWARLNRRDILDQEKRGMVRGYLAANPGANLAAIRADLGIAGGTLAYHLWVLEREGILRSWKDGRFRRFALSSYRVGAPEHRLTDVELALLERIRRRPEITQKELATDVGLSQSTISYHMGRMAEQGIVRIERRGFRTLYAANLGDGLDDAGFSRSD